MPTGISNPNIIELITYDTEHDEFVLIICGPKAWEGSSLEENLLLQKLNNYYHYIQDGQLVHNYPQTKGKKLRLQIDCVEMPPQGIQKLIAQAQDLFTKNNINIQLRINLLS